MQTHDLQPKTPRTTKKLVGRGGKNGKTSGRGHKGQKARAGNSVRPAVRDLIKKIPKLRGYRFNSHRPKPVVVNIAAIAEAYTKGETVSKETLVAKGLVSLPKGTSARVKVLGEGEIKTALHFTDVSLSGSARDKINAAGGTIND